MDLFQIYIISCHNVHNKESTYLLHGQVFGWNSIRFHNFLTHFIDIFF